MLNTFKERWDYFKDGRFSLVNTEHFTFAIDRDWIGFEIDYSWKLGTFHVQIICLVFDIY